jgi:hypothetical protein
VESDADRNALVHFDFRGDALDVVRLPDGDVGVALRRLCEALGLDALGQRQRLARLAAVGARWATACVTHAAHPTGGVREIVVLPRRSIPMWAATVDVFRVSPEVRQKLVAYQDDCADVLAERFLGPGRAGGELAERVQVLEREVAALGRKPSRHAGTIRRPGFDRVVAFLRERGVEPGVETPAQALYLEFVAWCVARRFWPVTNAMFGRRVMDSGLYERRSARAGRLYVRRGAARVESMMESEVRCD